MNQDTDVSEMGWPVRLQKWFRIGLISLLIGALASTGVFLIRLRAVGTGEPREIQVEPGSNASQIIHSLADHGLIRDPLASRWWVKLTGNTANLNAGWYRLDPNHSTPQILRRLLRGDTIQEDLMIPEGSSLWDIARVWEQEGWGEAEAFLAQVKAEEARLRRPLEGYLFPDTYFLERGASAGDCIRQMLQRFEQQWNRLTRVPAGYALSRHEVVTLASIVEKEAQVDRERAWIAGVFRNRLERGWKLQADPTVAYILNYPKRPLSRRDLRVDSPYNTYLHKGLPPGPICNPGYASLQAAWRPLKTESMYFVARGDGTHDFSRTLAEHNQAIEAGKERKAAVFMLQ